MWHRAVSRPRRRNICRWGLRNLLSRAGSRRRRKTTVPYTIIRMCVYACACVCVCVHDVICKTVGCCCSDGGRAKCRERNETEHSVFAPYRPTKTQRQRRFYYSEVFPKVFFQYDRYCNYYAPATVRIDEFST